MDKVDAMRLIDAILTAGEEVADVTPEAFGDEFGNATACFYDGAIHVTINDEEKIFDLIERNG